MADDTPAASAPVAVPAPTLEARIKSVIRDWRDGLIAGGPIARAVECWNHLEQCLQPLLAAICEATLLRPTAA